MANIFRFSDLPSPKVFYKILRRFYFLFLTVPAVHNTCVCSLLEEQETLINKLFMLIFYVQQKLEQSSFHISRQVAEKVMASLGVFCSHWHKQDNSPYGCHVHYLPPSTFSAGIFCHIINCIMLNYHIVCVCVCEMNNCSCINENNLHL